MLFLQQIKNDITYALQEKKNSKLNDIIGNIYIFIRIKSYDKKKIA